jgi:serine/threonine protein kinase
MRLLLAKFIFAFRIFENDVNYNLKMPIYCPTCLTDNFDTSVNCITCGTPLSEPTYYLPSGTLLQQGKYRVEQKIGEGGFAITYKGFDLINSRVIAIKENWPEKASRQGKNIVWPFKITPQERQKQIQDVQNEANHIKKCIHPSIVAVYESFEENNTAYIIISFIEGKSLSKILKEEGSLKEDRINRYFIQVAEALKIVHLQQILHRDIKPDNILVNNQDIPVLIDFGAAREFIPDKTITHTQIVSEGYAPLEQYGSRAKRNASTDLYALCASMYELLTGELPASATDRIATETLVPPRQLAPHISPTIEQVILTGMKTRAEDRFQTADELIDALKGNFVTPSLKRSRLLIQQGKLSEAIQVYNKCLVDEPNNGEAAVELAMVQTYINDTQAEVAAQKAIGLKPTDGRGYGVLGLINCRKSNWLEAVKQLQQAVNLSPNESWLQANLAWAYGKSSKWQQAETAVLKALQLDSSSTFALGLQAWIAVNQEQWKPAIRAARIAITQSKQTNTAQSQELQYWVYPCLIVALDRAVTTKQPNDVDKCIQEFTTQVPDSAFAWGFKGWRQASLGLWTDVLLNFQQAKRQPRVRSWIFLNLGITYEHLQDMHKAIAVYEACNQTLPNHPFTLFRLGTLLGQQGQWLQANSFLKRAIELKPDYAEAHHNLGWVLLNIKSQDGSVKNFREMWIAYRKAVELYSQQQKFALAQTVKQAFEAVGVEL